MKGNYLQKRYRYITAVIVVALFSSVFFVISGCKFAIESAKEVNIPVQETVEGQPEGDIGEQATNINPELLTQAEEMLSLEGYGATGALADKDLSVLDMLTYAVQDEYLARGEYLAIIEKFGSQKPYSNIAQAEETHLTYLKELYSVYEIAFPEDSSADHIIIPDTLLEAAKTGVQAEIDNIAMYELFLTYDLPDDINEVFTVLKNASEGHLDAFQKQVDKLS
jgi:hypothetical protein